MAEEQVKLLTFWPSPFGMRVVLALELKGIAYEHVQEDLTQGKSELLLQSNPVYKKIPVLIHNGKPLAESAIIVQYIDEAWPSKDGSNFLPKDPYDRAVVRFWADYVEKKVFDALFSIVWSTGEALEKAKEDAVNCLMTLENALVSLSGGELPFFGGAFMNYIDILLAPIVPWYPAMESMGIFKFPSAEKCPRLDAWIKAVNESSCRKAIAHSDKIMEVAAARRKIYVESK